MFVNRIDLSLQRHFSNLFVGLWTSGLLFSQSRFSPAFSRELKFEPSKRRSGDFYCIHCLLLKFLACSHAKLISSGFVELRVWLVLVYFRTF